MTEVRSRLILGATGRSLGLGGVRMESNVLVWGRHESVARLWGMVCVCTLCFFALSSVLQGLTGACRSS